MRPTRIISDLLCTLESGNVSVSDRDFAEAVAKLEKPVAEMLPRRFELALPYVLSPVDVMLNWLVTSREASNYTYDLTPRNLDQLAWFVSAVGRASPVVARTYIDELLEDDALRTHIATKTINSGRAHVSDAVARYGRRLGWYALARILKPKVIVETGVDKGLGTCVLAAAVLRNAVGRVYGIDIDASVGELFKGTVYGEVVETVASDSVAYLKTWPNEAIDLFIHDSDHHAEHERAEFEAIAQFLSPTSIVLSDNSHVTTELSHYALRTQRQYLFFREEPAGHFYPGAGIGAAWSKS